MRTGADHPLARPLDGLYLACIWAAGAAITVMSVIIPIGVVMRYVFGFGAQWPEPIAILLMMVFTFIGAAAAYRANAHIAVTMFTDILPPPMQALAAVLVDLLMVVACAFVAWYGGRLAWETMGQSVAELPWLPVGVTYAALPIGSAITLLFVLERRIWGPQNERPIVRYEEEITPEAETA
jgi:TRAP-type C4-dicarboxylate transport system permease small subunit